MRFSICLPGLTLLLLACGGEHQFVSKANVPLAPTPRVLFPAGDLKTGIQLWTSDGTREGTRVLKEINPQSRLDATNYAHWSFPNVQATPFTLWKDRVWFFANDGVHGCEPWSSDGTETGTELLKDLNPGGSDSLSPWGSDLRIHVADDQLWFSGARSGDVLSFSDDVLWFSGGGEANTAPAPTQDRLVPFSGPYWLTPLEKGLACNAKWFRASSDGPGDGNTHLVGCGKDWLGEILQSGAEISARYPFRLGRDLLFWSSNWEHGAGHYRLINGGPDGKRGTTLLDLGNGSSPNPHWDWNLSYRDLNGLTFFEVDIPSETGRHYSLWRTDGTAAGTFKLMDLAELSGQIANCTVFFKGRWYFTADDGVHGMEPWSTDGTPEGTRLLADLMPGPTGSFSGFSAEHLLCSGGYFVFKDRLYFGADSPWGHVLWSSDGTPQGTAILANPARNLENLPCWPAAYAAVGDTLYFSAQDYGSTQRQLWRTDGTVEGTQSVTTFDFGKSLNPIWTIVPSPKP